MTVSKKIKPIIKEYIWGREIWYQNPQANSSILVKKIETHDRLSIQAPPNNDYAFKKENGLFGKKEVWLITKASEGAGVYYGFNKKYTKEEIKQHINSGTLEKTLNFFKVKTGDIILVEPGVVHAIGAGVELIETQQNSNLTYRLYDFNRVDTSGNKRELHIEKALDVINLEKSEKFVTGNFIDATDKTQTRISCSEKEFLVLEYKTEEQLEMTLLNSLYAVVNVITGEGVITIAGEQFNYSTGDAFWISKQDKTYSIIPSEKSHIVISKPGNIGDN